MSNLKNYVEGEVLIMLKEGVSEDQLKEALAKLGLQLKAHNRACSLVSCPVGDELKTKDVLAAESIVEVADLNHVVTTC